MDSLKKRHHYGTTGSRCILNTNVVFESDTELVVNYPDQSKSKLVRCALMGDVLRSTTDQINFHLDVEGPAPVERIDIRNALDTLEIFRPYSEDDFR